MNSRENKNEHKERGEHDDDANANIDESEI